MKILLLNQVFYPDPVATAQHSTDLARYLMERGHQVTVVASRRDYERRSLRYARRETYQGITIRRVPSTGLGKASFLRRFFDSITFEFSLLFELLRVDRPDVVMSFTSPPLIGVLGALYCQITGVRSVQWLMDVNPDIAIEMGYLRRGSLPERFLTALFDYSLRRSRNIVVLDRWMKARMMEVHGVPEEKLTVVPPWPIQEPSAAPPSPNPFRIAHGLENKFVVLYSGNHSLVHPLDTLLEVAVRMKEEKDVVFVFVGGGVRVKDVAQAARRHSLTNILQLPSQPRDMLKYSLTSADLHVVIMGNKASGLVHTSKIYGILATGLPYVFIGPARSHVAELIGQCPYGFEVRHGEAQRLEEVIRHARGLTPSERTAISRHNIEHLLRHYTPDRALGKFAAEVLGEVPAAEIGLKRTSAGG